MDTNVMEKNETGKETRETVQVTYQGIIHEITKEEFENLRDGWVTAKEMFE